MKSKNTFIIGAGFTKSVFNEAPLNNELLDSLLKENPNSKLNELSRKYNTKNIESMLTYLDIDISECKYDKTIRENINYEIARYFEKFRFKPEILKNNNWLEIFATKVFKRNDAIINLNYDCFLDGLLEFYGIWHPHGGYGILFNPLIDESLRNPKNIKMLKIHGSENFTIKPIEQIEPTEPYFVKSNSFFVSYEFNEQIFTNTGKNRHLGNRSLPVNCPDALPYIIAPSYVKIPSVYIQYLMIDALEEIKKSTNLIIIGCSLRQEDNFLWLLVTNFFKQKNWESRKIVIVDPKAINISERISNFWGGAVDNNIYCIDSNIENSVEGLLKLITQLKKSTLRYFFVSSLRHILFFAFHHYKKLYIVFIAGIIISTLL